MQRDFGYRDIIREGKSQRQRNLKFPQSRLVESEKFLPSFD